MKQKIVAGNWKMHTTFDEATQLARSIANANTEDDVTVILAPPFPYLKAIHDMTMHIHGLKVAAQNCHYEDSGAFTGEVAAGMLASLSIPYVIIGHSERREYFHETDDILLTKLRKAQSAGLTPIFCCGEPLNIRERNTHVQFVRSQLDNTLGHLDAEAVSRLIVAYEPIWAIGTGKTASSEQAQDMHKEIRYFIEEKFGSEVANKVPILYGGSVKPGNAAELFANPDVDGGLVGGASLKAESFLEIIAAF